MYLHEHNDGQCPCCRQEGETILHMMECILHTHPDIWTTSLQAMLQIGTTPEIAKSLHHHIIRARPPVLDFGSSIDIPCNTALEQQHQIGPVNTAVEIFSASLAEANNILFHSLPQCAKQIAKQWKKKMKKLCKT